MTVHPRAGWNLCSMDEACDRFVCAQRRTRPRQDKVHETKTTTTATATAGIEPAATTVDFGHEGAVERFRL